MRVCESRFNYRVWISFGKTLLRIGDFRNKPLSGLISEATRLLINFHENLSCWLISLSFELCLSTIQSLQVEIPNKREYNLCIHWIYQSMQYKIRLIDALLSKYQLWWSALSESLMVRSSRCDYLPPPLFRCSRGPGNQFGRGEDFPSEQLNQTTDLAPHPWARYRIS